MTSDGTRTFEWDEENRLVSVTTTATGHRTEYAYDGLGRRVQIIEKDIAQDQTETISSDKKYLWVGTQIAEERVGVDGGTVTKRFYAQGFVDNDGTILFYTRDHLGSIRELVDMQQNVRARYDYDPYGIVTKVSGDRDSQFLYTGHFWDGRNGLYLTLFRAYDPVLGRWISRDPLGEDGGLNVYEYVGSDPLNRIDRYGLDWVYHQSTGVIEHVNPNGVVDDNGVGYAGHNQGLNNPLNQGTPGGGPNAANSNAGPLPQGGYTIGSIQNNITGMGVTLFDSMRLIPDPQNNMLNRAGFLIHGGNMVNRSSSQGCIVLPLAVRHRISNSHDTRLRVAP
jgi:RHS repeat-associated protein